MKEDDLDKFISKAQTTITKRKEEEYSSDALVRILQLQESNMCDFVEAVVLFCEEQDIDSVDFIKNCSKHIVQTIKQAAIDSGKIRKMAYDKPHDLDALFF